MVWPTLKNNTPRFSQKKTNRTPKKKTAPYSEAAFLAGSYMNPYMGPDRISNKTTAHSFEYSLAYTLCKYNNPKYLPLKIPPTPNKPGNPAPQPQRTWLPQPAPHPHPNPRLLSPGVAGPPPVQPGGARCPGRLSLPGSQKSPGRDRGHTPQPAQTSHTAPQPQPAKNFPPDQPFHHVICRLQPTLA